MPNPDVVNKRNIKYLSNKNINVGEGVFVVDKDKFNKISKIERKYLKPIYEPYLMDKYFLNSNNEKEILYITKNNWKNDAPSLLKHLHKYKEIMEQRRENKSGQIKYFHLHWARDSRFFEKCEKILSVRKCNIPTFVFYTDVAYVMMSINIIITYRINMKYLTGILNSKLVAYWLKKQGKMQGNNYQIDKEPLMNIPIHNPTQQQENSIVSIVNKILNVTKQENYLENIDNQNKVKEYEKQIDIMVYKLYELTYEEVLIIDKDFKLSKEDYNSLKL